MDDFFEDFLGSDSEVMDDHGFTNFGEEPNSISLASGNDDDTNWLSISPKDTPCFKGLHESAHDLLPAEIHNDHNFKDIGFD